MKPFNSLSWHRPASKSSCARKAELQPKPKIQGKLIQSVLRSGDSKHPSAPSALARRTCIGAIWRPVYCVRLSEGACKSSAQKAPSAATCNSALERYRNSQTGSRKHAVIRPARIPTCQFQQRAGSRVTPSIRGGRSNCRAGRKDHEINYIEASGPRRLGRRGEAVCRYDTMVGGRPIKLLDSCFLAPCACPQFCFYGVLPRRRPMTFASTPILPACCCAPDGCVCSNASASANRCGGSNFRPW